GGEDRAAAAGDARQRERGGGDPQAAGRDREGRGAPARAAGGAGDPPRGDGAGAEAPAAGQERPAGEGGEGGVLRGAADPDDDHGRLRRVLQLPAGAREAAADHAAEEDE